MANVNRFSGRCFPSCLWRCFLSFVRLVVVVLIDGWPSNVIQQSIILCYIHHERTTQMLLKYAVTKKIGTDAQTMRHCEPPIAAPASLRISPPPPPSRFAAKQELTKKAKRNFTHDKRSEFIDELTSTRYVNPRESTRSFLALSWHAWAWQ